MRVCINAGHGKKDNGAYDPGAIGQKGVKEAWQNVEVAKLMKPILEKAGWTVLLIQDGDLPDIVTTSNSFFADYFISVHCNSASDHTAHGIETYAYKAGGKGEKIAKAIQKELVKATGLTDRGVKFANFFVLRKTLCPAVLIETAFVSNPAEERLMMNQQYDEKVAKAICDGFMKGVK